MKISYAIECRPMSGQDGYSGDAARVIEDACNDAVLFIVVDALGHGREAQKVAIKSLDYCQQNASSPLIDILEGLHKHMRGSSGLVATVCRVHKKERWLRYSSIGDTAIMQLTPKPVHGLSRPGVIGYQMYPPIEHCWSLNDNTVIAIFSDGITLPSVDQFDDAMQNGVSSLSRYVVSNFSKPDDDALCLILKVAS